jgi:ABC-type polysaccharide/polyol phosphate transport system ATPase subunit
MTNVIETHGVTKIYPLYSHPSDRLREALSIRRKKYHKDFYALRDVSISVERGSCVGLIGMNGSGKSTLLQVIAGVVSPTHGKAEVHGRISALLELGAGFNPEYSGIENIKFQAALMGIPSEEIPDLIERVRVFADIGDFVYQPVKSYSSGMYVRLAFATAINFDPDILIVDEALAVGDIYFQTKCMTRIRQLREQGKTLLFVSHDAAAVKSLCDKAYLLHQGQVVDHGAPDAVFNHYNNLIAAKAEDAMMRSASQMRSRYGTGKILIGNVRIRNQAGTYTDTLATGEKVSLEIDFKAHAEIHSPTIGISIRDRLGIEIYGINNHNLGIDFGTVRQGDEYRVSYDIDLRLGQNTYSIAVSAHPEDTHVIECFDWVNDACIFRMVPSPQHKFVGACLLQTGVRYERI